jgi:hypothetical protein
MAVQQSNRDLEALRKLEASLNADLCAPQLRSTTEFAPHRGLTCTLSRSWDCGCGDRACANSSSSAVRSAVSSWSRWSRCGGGSPAVRSSSIIATPWLTAAIKENFGAGHDVEIGGTQIERDANGRTSLRIRDIVVRDAEGTVVASAPKAEVGVSGTGLLTGRIRAER